MDEREYEAMLALDERHWWYRGRRRVLGAVLDRLDIPPRARILDAGCGSGRTMDDLARYGQVQGIELSPLGLRAARARGHDVREARVEAVPFEDASFDLVTCLDVIEHTPDDAASLRELRRVTKPGGRLVLTVPAHPRLWSRHDEVNGHHRRYTRRSLRAAASRAGWTIRWESGFNVAYLAPAALVRATRSEGEASELTLTPERMDGLLELPLRAEAALARRGVRLPPGLSLLAVLSS